MGYPKEKRSKVRPILRFGGRSAVTWSHREYTPTNTIRKSGKKWSVIRNGNVIYKGTLDECRKV